MTATTLRIQPGTTCTYHLKLTIKQSYHALTIKDLSCKCHPDCHKSVTVTNLRIQPGPTRTYHLKHTITILPCTYHQRSKL